MITMRNYPGIGRFLTTCESLPFNNPESPINNTIEELLNPLIEIQQLNSLMDSVKIVECTLGEGRECPITAFLKKHIAGAIFFDHRYFRDQKSDLSFQMPP